MKREIKFRGKRSDNGEWVYGYLVKHTDETTHIIIGYPFGYPVDPETVWQYTGLNDKNEKEIYENDSTKIGVIVFADGAFWLDVERSEETLLLREVCHQIEVIDDRPIPNDLQYYNLSTD